MLRNLQNIYVLSLYKKNLTLNFEVINWRGGGSWRAGGLAKEGLPPEKCNVINRCNKEYF